MQEIQLLFNNSPWFILVCLAVGLLYAALLYFRSFRKKRWDKKINYALSTLRFIVVTLLCLLLVGPFIKQIKNNVEKPVIVFAVDNSSSIKAVEDSVLLERLKNDLSTLETAVEDKGYIADFQSFSEEGTAVLDNMRFDNSSSDIHGLLKDIASDYEGSNLSSVILFSDGIYNRGISPTYSPYSFVINTVGLGDTVPKQDINVNALYYNKIAYQGNKFPLVAEIENTGFANETVNVKVSRQGKTMASKPLKLNSNRGVNAVEFLLDAEQEGMQHYVVEVEPKTDEFTTQNNMAHAYLEVIEGKQKILMVAQSPHPDIKAMKSAIESNKNYEMHSVILSVDENEREAELANEKYDLVIFHQLPGKGINPASYEKYLKMSDSKFFIVGSQTDLSALNKLNPLVNIANINNDTDQVSAIYHQDFNGFQLDASKQNVISSFIPITVPFANVELKSGAQTLLYQKVGNVKTSKPMLVVGEQEGKKMAVMLAEGMWQWRLQEFANYENNDAFNTLLTKLTQYLSAKEDKRRFKVYPIENEFEDTEPVVFETEIYNDVYEQVYGIEVDLTISNENGEKKAFKYVTNKNNTQYRVSNLPEGLYQYTASTTIEGEKLTSEGEFTIKSLQIEALNLTANHNMLKQLAEESGGAFFEGSNADDLINKLESQQAKGKIYTSEAYLPIINLKWLFFLLMLLITTEWGVRKYLGSY